MPGAGARAPPGRDPLETARARRRGQGRQSPRRGGPARTVPPASRVDPGGELWDAEDGLCAARGRPRLVGTWQPPMPRSRRHVHLAMVTAGSRRATLRESLTP